MSDKETENFNLEKKVLIDIERLGQIENTYEYVNKDKDDLQKLDGVLKSLSADGFVRYISRFLSKILIFVHIHVIE